MLTNEEMKEPVKSSTDKDKETEGESGMWTLQKLAESSRMIQESKEKITEYDPWMERGINVTHMVTEAWEPLQGHYEMQWIKKKQWFPVQIFFRKVSLKTQKRIQLLGIPSHSHFCFTNFNQLSSNMV